MQNQTQPKPLGLSMAKLFLVAAIIVSLGAVAGVAGYLAKNKPSKIQQPQVSPASKSTSSITNETIICLPAITDIDNNIYNIVKIGEQCWTKENLKVTKNPEGKSITRYCYDNDPKIYETYGGLYNWDTAMNKSTEEGAQGICPNGWHVPKDSEWHILESYLTDNSQTCRAPKSLEWDCETAGTKLKKGGSSGFNGILSGERDSNGLFRYRGGAVDFWSSTEFIPPQGTKEKVAKLFESNGNYTHVLTRGLSSWSSVSMNMYNKASGLSIRCLKY